MGSLGADKNSNILVNLTCVGLGFPEIELDGENIQQSVRQITSGFHSMGEHRLHSCQATWMLSPLLLMVAQPVQVVV